MAPLTHKKRWRRRRDAAIAIPRFSAKRPRHGIMREQSSQRYRGLANLQCFAANCPLWRQKYMTRCRIILVRWHDEKTRMALVDLKPAEHDPSREHRRRFPRHQKRPTYLCVLSFLLLSVFLFSEDALAQSIDCNALR
jgi:hypothetical protein